MKNVILNWKVPEYQEKTYSLTSDPTFEFVNLPNKFAKS